MKRLFVFSVLLVLTTVGFGAAQALAATLSAPWISPDDGTFGEPIEVSMRCSDSQAKIYFTTDGSEPTESSSLYSSPFMVSDDMTIKAIAVKGSAVSSVSTATYKFVTIVHVENIAAYEEVPDGTLVEFDNSVVVLANSGENLYVQDGSGSALFYGHTGHYYMRGRVIPAGFQGKKITSNGEPMLTELKNFEYQFAGANVKPEYITADEVGPDKFAHLVSLDSVQFSLDPYYYLYDDYWGTLTDKFGNGCPILFGTMGVRAPENESVFYDIEAVVGSHETEDGIVYMLLPVTFERIIPDEPPLEISPSQVGPETLGKNVVLRQVTYPSGTITDLNDETCECLLTYDPILPQVLCWSYDAYGVVESYGTSLPPGVERYRVFITGIGLNSDDDAMVKNIKSLYNLNYVQWVEYFNLKGHFTTPLTAVYQYNDYLYVKDVDGRYGLVFGEVDSQFHNGDLITGAVAQAKETAGEWRIYPAVTSSFVKDGNGGRVYPDELTVADVDNSMIHRFVVINDVKVVQESNRVFRMTDNTGEMMIYNKFNLKFPPGGTHHWLNDDGEINIGDYNRLMAAILENSDNPDMWDGTYDVKGFLGYGPSGQVVLYPIEFYRGESFDVNDDGEVNIADTNVIIDLILYE